MKLFIRILILIIISLPVLTNAQSRRSAEKKQRELDKLKERREKEREEAYREAVKQHYQMQSPQTKRMMKQTSRKSLDDNKGFFLKRWFNNVFNKKRMQKNKENKGINPNLRTEIPTYYINSSA